MSHRRSPTGQWPSIDVRARPATGRDYALSPSNAHTPGP